MTYLNLGVALFLAAYALYSFGPIVRTAFTKADYESQWFLLTDAFAFALCGALSAWNFNLAVSA